jgi:hypothetical protein
MMSAFHPIATEQRTQFYVGFVPEADIGAPLGILMISAGEHPSVSTPTLVHQT